MPSACCLCCVYFFVLLRAIFVIIPTSIKGPGTYAFGYEIEDIVTGNIQFRDEVKLRNGTVKGSYGVLLPDDTLHATRYIADHLGYR